MKRCSRMYFGTNTKLSKTDGETLLYLEQLVEETKDIGRDAVQMFVIPSFTVLARAHELLASSGILLGAQNMCTAERGQFTGEVSPLSLRENGVTIAEIGHSERRHLFGETDDEERQKVSAAVRHGLQPLLCIGETVREKELGIADEILSIQLKVGTGALPPEEAVRLMVAYEPVWAIGTQGVPAPPEYVSARHRHIRGILTSLFGYGVGGDIPILFGGSVDSHNAPDYIRLPHVNGLFVGRSAWTAKGFSGLIRQTLPLYADK